MFLTGLCHTKTPVTSQPPAKKKKQWSDDSMILAMETVKEGRKRKKGLTKLKKRKGEREIKKADKE